MNTLLLILIVWDICAVLVGLVSIYRWVRRGMPTPRWMHLGAATATCLGILCLTAIAIWEPYMISATLTLALLIAPPALWYVIWLVCVGPDSWMDQKPRGGSK
ncbi:hypothetical protein ACFL34_05235 [Candidatus Sumerlaeota bacterium]